MKNRKILIVFLLFPFSVCAQTPLTLEECLVLARENGIQYQQMQKTLETSYESLRQARAPFNLDAALSLTSPSYSDNRRLLDDPALTSRVRNESTNLTYGGAIAMSQEVHHVGRFSANLNSNRQDFSSNRQLPFIDYSGNVRLNYSRDLLRESRSEIQLQQVEYQLEIARLNFQRSEMSLEASVTNAYHSMIQSIRQYEIEEQSFNQSKAALELANRRFQVGLIAEVEALRLQVDLLTVEARYTSAQRRISQARDSFREILGMDLDEPFEIVIDNNVDYVRYAVNRDKALEIGLRQNANLLIAQLQEKNSAIDLQEVRSQVGPTATLNANISFLGQGDDVGEISSTFERSSIGAGITVNVPLIDSGTRRSQLRRAQIQESLSQLETDQLYRQITLQIRTAVENVWEAERQIDILQAALDVAERTYEVELARFDLGYTSSQQLLNSQEQLALARTNALNAIITYQSNLLQLRLVTMADLTQMIDEAN
jgi:outer membrane protein